MIVDLSSPDPNSVNHSLRYASMDDALRLIRSLGPGCLLLKMDLKDAYRVVPIHPGDLVGGWSVCGSFITFWAAISAKVVHSSGRCNGRGSLLERDKVPFALPGRFSVSTV